MPVGGDPPNPGFPQALFNSLHGMTYDARNMAFANTGGTLFWLFAQKKSGGSYDQATWFYATDADGGSSPKGLIPQITADVVLGGTYTTTTESVSYQGSSYRFRLKRDTSGNQLAEAFVF